MVVSDSRTQIWGCQDDERVLVEVQQWIQIFRRSSKTLPRTCTQDNVRFFFYWYYCSFSLLVGNFLCSIRGKFSVSLPPLSGILLYSLYLRGRINSLRFIRTGTVPGTAPWCPTPRCSQQGESFSSVRFRSGSSLCYSDSRREEPFLVL